MTEEHLLASRIGVRVYRPRRGQPCPTVVYFHGGGWQRGSLDSADRECELLSRISEAVVVSVAYRLAPRHPWPDPIEDGFEALKWASNQIRTLGGDGTKIAVAGESSGATIAAVLAQESRNTFAAKLCAEMLLYPPVDLRSGTLDYPSRQTFRDGYFLTREKLEAVVQGYTGNVADLTDAKVSPLFGDLRGLPPTLIVSAEHDPLRDEVRLYASRLKDAGVEVVDLRFAELAHAFVNQTNASTAAHDAAVECFKAFRGLLWA